MPARCFVYCRKTLNLNRQYLPVVRQIEVDCPRSREIDMYSVPRRYSFVVSWRYFTVVFRASYFVSLALVALFYHRVHHLCHSRSCEVLLYCISCAIFAWVVEVVMKPSDQIVTEYLRDVDLRFTAVPFIHDIYKLCRSEGAFGEGNFL